MLHLSAAILSPLHQLLLWAFHFPTPRQHFLPIRCPFFYFFIFFYFLSFPYTTQSWVQMHVHLITLSMHEWNWDVYCTWTDTLLEPAHTLYFPTEAMDRLEAWNENPLNRTFFTFPCITVGVTDVVTLSQRHDSIPRLFSWDSRWLNETKICESRASGMKT